MKAAHGKNRTFAEPAQCGRNLSFDLGSQIQ